jgi:hypothetical protein
VVAAADGAEAAVEAMAVLPEATVAVMVVMVVAMVTVVAMASAVSSLVVRVAGGTPTAFASADITDTGWSASRRTVDNKN